MSTIGISNILFRDFEQEDRSNVACFAVGCSLTFVGVKLLTSRRDRSRSASHSHRGGGGSGRDDASLARLSHLVPHTVRGSADVPPPPKAMPAEHFAPEHAPKQKTKRKQKASKDEL